jgi:hypothetical protein
MRQSINTLIIILAFIFVNLFASFGAQPVVLDKLEDYVIGGQYIEIFEDQTNSFSFSDILNGKSDFKSVQGNYLATNNTESTYWVRFKVESFSKEKRKWVLEILDSRQDTVILYEPNGANDYTTSIAGIQGGFSNRQYKHKNFVFELSLNNPQSKYYYLKFKSSPITSLLFKIRTVKDFAQYGLNEYYMLGLYYGILAMMAFYSLFVYLTTREKVYLFYILYILSWMYYSMIRDGTGYQYIWPDVNFISTMGFYISKPLLLGAFLGYCLEFLSFASYPKLRNITIGLLIFYFLYYLAENIFDFSFLDNLFFLVPFLIIFYVSVMNYRAGYKPARYFLIGNSIVVFCIIVANLRDSGLLEMIVHIDLVAIIAVYSTNIGMVLEIMILSFALADRVKFLKIEREKTQLELIHQLNENQRLSEKVNRELEEKVTERTQVIEEKSQLLEEANLKLIHQSEKINQMNALLDIDNWNLKKSLIEEKESRIKLKDISFEEFMQVYPNDTTCFKYLEELKWPEGFACIKCGNIKFGKGINVFSRRCTRCRYDETITTNTIFYRCKFPINKALYIVATINRYGEDMSITELSNKLELRNATCWAFVKKVLKVRKKSKYDSIPDEKKLAFLVLNV